MKYPCELIRDILPLYHDEVASNESRKAVEEHLQECSKCKAYYETMCESDAIEPVVYDEEKEKQLADSYKNVYKKIIKKVSKFICVIALVVVAFILAVYILVVSVVGMNAAASWEEHRDIGTYGVLEDGTNVIDGYALYEYNLGGPVYVDNIWPEEIVSDMNVKDYLLIHYEPWDSNYLSYLVVEYDQVSYQQELLHLENYPSTEYIGNYGMTGFDKHQLLAIQTDKSELIYALTDGKGTIIYVGLVFPGYSMDVDYEKYIPNEYLPKGLDLSENNPTREEMINR